MSTICDRFSYSHDDDKTDFENQLDTIRDTIKKHVPTSMTETITEMARENASSLLSSHGLGTTINTTV